MLHHLIHQTVLVINLFIAVLSEAFKLHPNLPSFGSVNHLFDYPKLFLLPPLQLTNINLGEEKKFTNLYIPSVSQKQGSNVKGGSDLKTGHPVGGIPDCEDLSTSCNILLGSSLCHHDDVKKVCPFACQACTAVQETPDCHDSMPPPECRLLAVAGMCNNTEISNYCLHSCGICTHGPKTVDCFNRFRNCMVMAWDSWCIISPVFMKQLCPLACGVCN